MPILGIDRESGAPVELTPAARRQGVYLIGTTGCGKTTLLQNLIYQDMADPIRPGLCVLDPHGDFIDAILERVPDNRWDDVILFAPGELDQMRRPLGLNILECDRSDPKQVARVTSTVVDTLRKLFFYSWGPRMEDLLRHSILTLMETPDTTLLDLLLLLASDEERSRYTKMDGLGVSGLSDPVLRHFWQTQFAAYNRRERVEVVGSSLNKIGRFLANPLIRNIVAQPRNAFNLRTVMDQGKILLVNLSKGDIGEDNTFLLGGVLINLILIAALQRRDTPPEQRRPFHLIVDEFQNFATESFATLQGEARKYAIDVIVAHQYRDQLDELNLGSTLNVANFITMRVSGKDSFDLSAQFDNTPPAPDKRMEPVYKQYSAALPRSLSGTESVFEVYKPLNQPTPFREVEQPRRPYSDVQAETANHLATLPNYYAECRLVGDRGLVEASIKTLPPLPASPQELIDKGFEAVVGVVPASRVEPAVKRHIRRQSLGLGMAQSEVEQLIADKIEGLVLDDPNPPLRDTLDDISAYGDKKTT